jgi:hypothetical protein
MMCTNCSKLAFIYTKKRCIRCQAEVLVTVAVLCELCSLNDRICSVCLKKISNPATVQRGCGCGGKK